MHIALLCATNRGYRFARLLFELGRGHDFTVFSFRETAWEPPFLDDIRGLTLANKQRFIEARNVARPSLAGFWRDTPVDLLLMVSWRYIVPREIYGLPGRGSYVFHDSLLPRYRGFAPTVWAIINGERQTGVSLFRAAEDMDAGDIVTQRSVAIGDNDAIADVMERVTQTCLDIAECSFADLLHGSAKLTPQDHGEASYTCKWTPADARIDWTLRARDIHNLIRATSQPYPGAYTTLDGRKLTIWSAALPSESRRYVTRAPGRVVRCQPGLGATVLTGEGAILLKTVQLESQPIVNAASLLGSLSLTLGERNR